MDKNIFAEVQQLGLPLGSYVVVSGGVLAAHGLRAYGDVDVLATPEAYAAALAQGGWEEITKNGLKAATKGNAEMATGMLPLPGYAPDVAQMIAEADIINGVAFATLQETLTFKRAMGRDKDKRDIALIENYLLEQH